MASHYAKKFEDLYEVFNKRVGGGAGRKVNKKVWILR